MSNPHHPWLPLILLVISCGLGAEPVGYRTAAEDFVREMVERHAFNPVDLEGLMAGASYRQEIVDAMDRPYEAKPWHSYRELFVTPERTRDGVAYWRDHADLLARAEASFGVDPGVIVAIIGVETRYGANVGKHRVIDALTTLGFAYPRRAEFFRGELESFLLLSRDEQLDTMNAVGSYAGAMGKPQFIPSSYRNHALDFDGDGRRDLWGSDADVIGSVAQYLARHGWRAGEPVARAAQLTAGNPADIPIAEKSPVAPKTTLADLRAAGVVYEDQGLVPGAPATLIRLEGQAADEHWIGLTNFYVITRYNLSNLYAMAVHQLSEAIAAARSDEIRQSAAPIDPGAAR